VLFEELGLPHEGKKGKSGGLCTDRCVRVCVRACVGAWGRGGVGGWVGGWVGGLSALALL
jgi:hypothetical protein